MKKLSWWFALLIFIHLIIVLFSQQALFTSRFDQAYWQERFEQSQWRLPLSQRVIGDDGLYLYAGSQLIHGADPTSLNVEMPPLGKYLIGLSLILFKNGYFCGLIVNLLVLLSFFFLSQALLKNKRLSLATTAALTIDPLFTNQYFRTMLDNIQLLFLIIFLLLLGKTAPKSKKVPILTGIALGFFSATKLPVFSPFLLLLATFLIWKKTKRLFPVFAFWAASFLAYLAVYWRFFTLGNSFFDWLGVQKWIISFYRQSLLGPNTGSALTTILLNRYQNLFTKAPETIEFWSLGWPIITILGFWGLIKKAWIKNFSLWRLITVFIIIAFAAYNLIPFWPRYLLIILPFFYLGFIALVSGLKKEKLAWVGITVVIGLNWLPSFKLLFPTPEKRVQQFLYDWKGGFFADLYQQITPESQQGKTRQEFHRFGQKAYYDAEIEGMKLEIIDSQWSRWQSPQKVKVKATYFTRQLGPFSEEKELVVVKNKQAWQVKWQWACLVNGLSEGAYLETKVFEAKRGTIFGPEQEKLAQDLPSQMIWITSGQVDPNQEEAMNQYLEDLFEEEIAAAAFHHRYVSANWPQQPIPIGVPPQIISPEQEKELKSFKGLKLTPKLGRFYLTEATFNPGKTENTYFEECCSRLYSTTNYDGVGGLEKEKNQILKGENGGYLRLKNQQGQTIWTIIQKERKDGQDIQL